MDFNFRIIIEKCWILGCVMSVNIMPMCAMHVHLLYKNSCANSENRGIDLILRSIFSGLARRRRTLFGKCDLQGEEIS